MQRVDLFYQFQNWKRLQIFLIHDYAHYVLASSGCQALYHECMDRLTWNKRDMNWCGVGSTTWPWPLTTHMSLTLDCQEEIFKYIYFNNGWSISLGVIGYGSIRCCTNYMTLTCDLLPWPSSWIPKIASWNCCFSNGWLWIIWICKNKICE